MKTTSHPKAESMDAGALPVIAVGAMLLAGILFSVVLVLQL